MALSKLYLTPNLARSKPTHIDARVLAANVNEAHAIPAGALYVIFSADGDFYARPDTAAAVPAADVIDGTGSEMNPVIWECAGAANINLIAPAARVVTLSFYN